MTSDDAGRPDRERGTLSSAVAGVRLSEIPSVLRLCEAWRRQSMDYGWAAHDDWRVTAVDLVAAAAWRGAGLAAACGLLGRERARAGIGIGETLTDLSALCHVLDGEDPPLELVKPLGEGWAEAGLARMSEASCEDPLTGLTTLPYLRARLGEVYREARQAGGRVTDSHRLLITELPSRLDPWDRICVLILVGNDLRATFPAGETLSLAGAGRTVALVPAVPELAFRVAGLRRRLMADHGVRLRLLQPPAQYEDAVRLLGGLAR